MTTAPFIIISIGMKIEMEIEGRARLGGAVTGKKERERERQQREGGVESVADTRQPTTWRRDGS